MTVFVQPCYSFTLTLQFVHLALDILINALSAVLWTTSPVALVVFYVVQDLGLIVAAIFTFLVFFDTYAFKAGLLNVLCKKFSYSFIMAIVYGVFTVGYQSWSIYLRFSSKILIWNGGLQILYIVQKLLAVGYYYSYKRAALKLGDMKYYEDSVWLRTRLNT